MKVFINQEEWWPVNEPSQEPWLEKCFIEVPDEILKEYEEAKEKFLAVQRLLDPYEEQCGLLWSKRQR